MTTDPNEPNPYRSPLASVVPGESVRRRFPWGAIFAIPLFVYGAPLLIFGAWGLLFVPAILLGAVSIGEHTTLLGVFGGLLSQLLLTAHGCAVVIAGISFLKMRWRRGLYAILIGVIAPGILIGAFYIAFVLFGAGN